MLRCGHEHQTTKYYIRKGTKSPIEPPRGLGSGEGTVPTRLHAKEYASTSGDAGKFDTMVTGMLSILTYYALTIFDSSSMHTFISMSFVSRELCKYRLSQEESGFFATN